MTVLLCACGCGEPAAYAARHVPKKMTRARKMDNWVEEDRGFETPCWIWMGARTQFDPRRKKQTVYGRIYIGGKYVAAHRVLYQDRIGPIPDEKQLHHRCEVTLCVNPTHMLAVTTTEHSRLRPHKRLNENQVRAIRRSVLSRRELATLFGVSYSLVSQIVNRTTWIGVE